MELWSARNKHGEEILLDKVGARVTVYINSDWTPSNYFNLDRKHMKDLFEALGEEIGYWKDGSNSVPPPVGSPVEAEERVHLVRRNGVWEVDSGSSVLHESGG